MVKFSQHLVLLDATVLSTLFVGSEALPPRVEELECDRLRGLKEVREATKVSPRGTQRKERTPAGNMDQGIGPIRVEHTRRAHPFKPVIPTLYTRERTTDSERGATD
jgi:hypothetical protein